MGILFLKLGKNICFFAFGDMTQYQSSKWAKLHPNPASRKLTSGNEDHGRGSRQCHSELVETDEEFRMDNDHELNELNSQRRLRSDWAPQSVDTQTALSFAGCRVNCVVSSRTGSCMRFWLKLIMMDILCTCTTPPPPDNFHLPHAAFHL